MYKVEEFYGKPKELEDYLNKKRDRTFIYFENDVSSKE